MTLFDLWHSSFRLWWKTLQSVFIFSFMSGLLKSLPYFFHFKIDLDSSVTYQNILMTAGMGLLNLIPMNAILAKMHHTAHQQSLRFSQALAISLLKFPVTALWYFITLIILYLIIRLTGFMSLSLLPLTKALFVAYCIVIAIFSVYCTLTPFLLVNENNSVGEGIKKSIRLIHHHWWYTGAALALPVSLTAFTVTTLGYTLGPAGIILGVMLFNSLTFAVISQLYEYLHQDLTLPISRNKSL